MMHKKGTVGVATLGCKVNQYESRAMEEALERRGYEICPHNAVCDAYIVNTCTVTAESDRKCRQVIRRLHTQNPEAYLVVTGCFAQADPEGAALVGVDAVIGNEQKMRVVEILDRLFAQGHKNDMAYTEVGERVALSRCISPRLTAPAPTSRLRMAAIRIVPTAPLPVRAVPCAPSRLQRCWSRYVCSSTTAAPRSCSRALRPLLTARILLC